MTNLPLPSVTSIQFVSARFGPSCLPYYVSVVLCSVSVQPVTVVRDLKVVIDAELSMHVYVSQTVQTFYCLHRLRFCHPLGRDVSRHGLCQPLSCRGWITAMPSLQAFRLQRWRRSRECCMLQLIWC